MQRIVTGFDPAGQPAVLFEGTAPTVLDFGKFVTTELWVTDSTPPDTTADEDTSLRVWNLEPPARGTAFRLVKVLPEGEIPAAVADAGDPEFLAAHATDTIDYVVVLSGQVTMIIGDREITLHPGDSVVQRCTPHDWQNRGDLPCLLAGVLVSTRG
jgi:mannose-6-phosphate isomerase-like protein (cupin superfamily)